MDAANVQLARRKLRAIETGDADALGACYASDAVQIEHPNKLKPQGDRRDKAKMLADSVRGRGLLARQKYEVLSETGEGDRLALQVLWKGVLAVALGPLQAGDSMRAHSGMFLRFENGVIAEQHNYDCFEAF